MKDRSNRINILHLITELNTGGAEMMLYRLVTRMDHTKFRHMVVSMTDVGPIGEKIKSEGIPVFDLGMTLGRPSIKGFAKLANFLKREPVDIIQTWLYHADLLGLIAGKMTGIKKIIWGVRCSDMHLQNYRYLTRLTVKMGSVLSPFVDAIVVNSEEGRQVHKRRGYDTKRMILISNGIDSERFCPDELAKDWLIDHLALTRDVAFIGLVARFDPMKDQKTFLKAASKLAERTKAVHFIMIGKGMDKDNKELIPLLQDGHLKNRVHLLGLREDIPRLTAALDIATSSSAYGEGFSNTIAEAMSCGVPCVVTDVGDSARIVGDTGLVVPPKNPEAMAEAWHKILGMGKEKREAMGKKARLRIVENFEIAQAVNRFESIYEKLVSYHC